MDLLHTGSDELIYIQTEKVNVTVKGQATHPSFQNVEISDEESILKVHSIDTFEMTVRGETVIDGVNTYSLNLAPIFYEQQRYEIIIEAKDGSVEFWHDNINIRNKVTKVGRNNQILSGVINFGNEIGLSDLVIKLDGYNYLRLVAEVFPTKISYKEDYKNIIADVTSEVYNLVFDFLKKTYLGYRQNDTIGNSPVEFFAVINHIFSEFVKSADMILAQPHHILETTHQVLPSHKIKQIDSRAINWIEKHPDQATYINGNVAVSRTMAVKKQVTYDTKENRLTKYILQSTVRKLHGFKNNYLKLLRGTDEEIIKKIDLMISQINRRLNSSFLAEVDPQPETASMSLVFSMASGYRDLYKYYLMLLHGLTITGDVFNISIKDLAILYEYWCFIKLNSLMKERYQLLSQDIIKVQGNGLFVSLVKGSGSKVKYHDPKSGDIVTLSYNPKEISVPTVSQKPDNVLRLEKKGAENDYEYVFDAKYRINPALPGSDYYSSISHEPGPEVSDINTMHRYRDAIVYNNGANPYERTMFGAYVLFPYNNENEYKNHRFYKSIEKVNIGGLPFLPSATGLVEDMLDSLVADSPESAFERATLPIGIENKLAKVDWSVRDVLIGDLRNKTQLDICLKHRFYHIPARRIKDADLPIHYIAIYQSNNLFGKESGIRYYGEVLKTQLVPRKDINEIPSGKTDLYYRFEVKDWKQLPIPIKVKESYKLFFTNLFLLEHSKEVPELMISSEEEFRLYNELKRLAGDAQINDESVNLSFKYNGALIAFEDGYIVIYSNERIVDRYSITDFSKYPNSVFGKIKSSIMN